MVLGPTLVQCCSTLHFICRAVCFISLQFRLYLSESPVAPGLRYEYICVGRFRLELIRQFVVPVNTDGTVQLCSLLQSVFLLRTLYVFELRGSFRLWGRFTVRACGSNVEVLSAWRRASER